MNLRCEHAQGGQQGMGSREAQVNHVSQLLFHSLAEKWTQKLVGIFRFRFCFLVFFLGGFFCLFVWFFSLLDNGCRVKACSFPLPLSPFQRISVTIPTSTAATVILGSQKPPLLSATISSEHAQQEWFRIIPIHLQKKPTQLQLPYCGVHQFAGTGGVCICTCMGGYGGAWRHSSAHWPSQMTLVSLSLKILVSTVILQV